jgi:hypothetical protein
MRLVCTPSREKTRSAGITNADSAQKRYVVIADDMSERTTVPSGL